MDFDREKVVVAYVAESEEGLQAMEESLIALESDSADPELLDNIFRVAHTIKGNASALDFPELASFAHRVEDLLDAIRTRKLSITAELISLVLHAVDALRALVPAAAEGNDQLSPSHVQLKEKIAQEVSGAESGTAYVSEEGPSPVPVSGPVSHETRNRTL